MPDLTIREVHAWEALDSRGRPTVGCRVRLGGGGTGRVVVPSGASTGAHEAQELRDGGSRYQGWGVQQAVRSVNDSYAPAVLGSSAGDRSALDAQLEILDGRRDLSRLGSNAALAVSLAVTVAASDGSRTPLWQTLDDSGEPPLIPMPMVNIFSGGAHAGRAVDIQDFLAVPVGATSFAQAIEWVARVRRSCAELLDAAGGWSALVADEGGLSARLPGNEDALALVSAAIDRAGFRPLDEMAIAVDVAASQLVDAGQIVLSGPPETLTPTEWVDRVTGWAQQYPLISIEDVVGEDDWESWRAASDQLGHLQLLGDDLFATDNQRLQRGIDDHVANAVLVKVNQAGTVSRAEQVMRQAQQAGYATVVSARSGDTEDHWLADLAVGWRAGQIKVGSTMRSERTAKWNRLLEIESSTSTQFAPLKPN